MNAHYPYYPGRHCLNLDGIWDFKWLGDVDSVTFDPASDDCGFDEIAAVPGCYNLAGERIGKRGVALYRTTFRFPAGAARLKFGGLGLYGRVWVDGVYLGQIRTPYTSVSYELELGERQGDYHELIVLVDNRFGNEQTVPVFKPHADFYGWGGIYRSVTLMQVPALRVERVKVSTLDIATGRVRLQVRLGGQWATGEAGERLRVCYTFDRGVLHERETTICAGQKTFTIETQVPEHRLWSVGQPHLHTLELSVAPCTSGSDSSDSIVECFGIRTIETRGREILLNSKPIRLLGVNRHESHPQFGASQPPQLIADDLQLVQELNANFIRAVHYQPDSNFLAACDRKGVLVWAESLGWDQPEADATNAETVALFKEAVVSLVEESLNNPSVIIYGFLNESCSDTPAGRKLYALLVETIRQLDDTRLISYASNRFEKDLCFDLVDIISVNPYPGWIGRAQGAGAGSWLEDYLACIRPEFDKIARYFGETPRYAAKPLLVSESGACGIYGMRDRMRAQWSEEFQQDYFAEAIASVLENPLYAGIALWQMYDTRSYVNVGPQIRVKPRGFNNAGVLDEYRRPKLVFDTVQTLFEHYGKAEPAAAALPQT